MRGGFLAKFLNSTVNSCAGNLTCASTCNFVSGKIQVTNVVGGQIHEVAIKSVLLIISETKNFRILLKKKSFAKVDSGFG